jgi:hypothetical protein
LGAQRGGRVEGGTEDDATRSGREHRSKRTPGESETAKHDLLHFFGELLAESFDIVFSVRDTLDLISESAEEGKLGSKARATNLSGERLTRPG